MAESSSNSSKEATGKRKHDVEDSTTMSSSKSKKISHDTQPFSRSNTKTHASTQSSAQALNRLLSRKGNFSTSKGQKSSARSKRDSPALPPTEPQPLTPFEELLSTVVLSRPIQHYLGHRALNILLNSPYSLRTPRAILNAGAEKIYEALDKAKTLHKDKTAKQLVEFAHTVIDEFEFESHAKGDKGEKTGLEKLRKDAQGDFKKLKNMVSNQVKGVGETGADIFVRRIQRFWIEFWPYIDARTSSSLETLDLPGEGSSLKVLIEECWDNLDIDAVKERDIETQKREVFVRVLEGAIDAYLKGDTGGHDRQTRSGAKKKA